MACVTGALEAEIQARDRLVLCLDMASSLLFSRSTIESYAKTILSLNDIDAKPFLNLKGGSYFNRCLTSIMLGTLDITLVGP